MTHRIFVDADIILDLLLAREPFFEPANRLFQLLEEQRVEGWTSPVIFANLFYVLRRSMPAPEAIENLRKLRLLLGVVNIDEQTVDRALASSFSDFEDALQNFAAVGYGLQTLVTRNKQDYKSSELRILNAAECVQLIEND